MQRKNFDRMKYLNMVENRCEKIDRSTCKEEDNNLLIFMFKNETSNLVIIKHEKNDKSEFSIAWKNQIIVFKKNRNDLDMLSVFNLNLYANWIPKSCFT